MARWNGTYLWEIFCPPVCRHQTVVGQAASPKKLSFCRKTLMFKVEVFPRKVIIKNQFPYNRQERNKAKSLMMQIWYRKHSCSKSYVTWSPAVQFQVVLGTLPICSMSCPNTLPSCPAQSSTSHTPHRSCNKSYLAHSQSAPCLALTHSPAVLLKVAPHTLPSFPVTSRT